MHKQPKTDTDTYICTHSSHLQTQLAFPCLTRFWLFWFFCPSNNKHALIPLKPWLFCLGEKQKEIIYFTVEIGSFYVNVKSAGEKWTHANFHHHCLVVSLLPTVHINNRNIYFITFLHLFINCPALFPFITILNMQKNANGNRDVSVRNNWTLWCLKKQQNKNQKKTQNTPILKALSPSKSTFPSRSFTFPHLSPSESVFLQPSSSLNLLFFFHKFPPVYPPSIFLFLQSPPVSQFTASLISLTLIHSTDLISPASASAQGVYVNVSAWKH